MDLIVLLLMAAAGPAALCVILWMVYRREKRGADRD